MRDGGPGGSAIGVPERLNAGDANTSSIATGATRPDVEGETTGHE